jgi:hypothetical protein
MSAYRSVPTRAIQSAVKGREAQVLAKLEIDWKSGRQHIKCPYPSHEDNDPSWRWDDKKARAHCTCRKSHSIFDMVMAKFGDRLRCSEDTRRKDAREDLIQDRGQPKAVTIRPSTRRAC